jgi:hydroxyacylglutathione hydrolase
MSKAKSSNNTMSSENVSVAATFVEAINAFNDNYIWAIRSSNNNALALVDPGDAKVCIDYIEQHGLVLASILVTHHHSDHVGGIKTLLEYAKSQNLSVTVYGPANENIADLDKKLNENDNIFLAELDCQFSILDLPGHTKGHIAYLQRGSNREQPTLFCGDTLFSGGCGRLFEGTPEQMHTSLNKLAALADNTLVYCAHEYTQANLAFALTVEPTNHDLQQYATQVDNLRLQNKRSIPSSIGLEKKINPFLRCAHKSISLAAEHYNENKKHNTTTEIFGTIRQWKDVF